MYFKRVALTSCIVTLSLCAQARAESTLDGVELRFAQAKPQAELPMSRDELFGAPAKAAPKPKAAAPAEPASRDELFGRPKAKPAAPDKPASPATREELFGTPAKPATPVAPSPPHPASSDELFAKPAPQTAPEGIGGPKWSGFFNETVAYTYGSPNHWSRAVSRLQITGQGALGGGLKYKVSARVDVDPVYMSNDFYPERVQEDQEHDFFLRENYLDFSAGALDFRVGRQQIVWGEVVGLFFADVVSARDMREFILPGFDIMRIPQWAARAEYFHDDFHAEVIWLPLQSVDDIGKPGSDFYPSGQMAELTPGARFASHDEPDNTLSNSAYGLRLNTLVSGWDLAAFYYRSHATNPVFYREVLAGGDVVFTPRNDRIWQVGSTLSKDLGDFVLRAEAVFTSGQR
ncbi:MAG TPA: DUF1302 family protein, partial [Burkholderiales bacterium]|nr:DUF1302 family protein [Burkholderiales bacterium]